MIVKFSSCVNLCVPNFVYSRLKWLLLPLRRLRPLARRRALRASGASADGEDDICGHVWWWRHPSRRRVRGRRGVPSSAPTPRRTPRPPPAPARRRMRQQLRRCCGGGFDSSSSGGGILRVLRGFPSPAPRRWRGAPVPARPLASWRGAPLPLRDFFP